MYPMGMVTQRMTQGRWISKFFTASTTLVVPQDVGCIWIDGCGGGGAGGAGHSAPGGGGGGGGAAQCVRQHAMPVEPGETLLLTVGAAGLDSNGNPSLVIGLLYTLRVNGGWYGNAGANPNGGAGAANHGNANSLGPVGGAGAGSIGTINNNASTLNGWSDSLTLRESTGAAGGALNYNGGGTYRVNTQPSSPVFYTQTIYGGTGSASGGGGGAGASSYYGDGGKGGNGGVVGSPATGYGGGGGGGGGNAAGGAGSPGFIRVYCFTSCTL